MEQGSRAPAGPFRHAPGLCAVLILTLMWALLYLPNSTLRELHDEEGRRAFLARDLLENGNWLQPRVLGLTYLNKPPLQPWLMALSARLTGRLDEWSIRLPALLMTLAGALLVFAVARQKLAWKASLCAAAAFLLSPLVMEKARIGETDTTATVTVLAAFYFWWRGVTQSRLGVATWLACALALSAAVLAKGPAPLAFFGLGILGFSLTGKRFGELAGLTLALVIPLGVLAAWSLSFYEPGHAAVWLDQLRLTPRSASPGDYLLSQLGSTAACAASLLPWLILALPALVPAWARRLGIDRTLSLALLWYAGGFALLLIFWPRMKPRYLMPAVPALAVAFGAVWGAMAPRSRFRRGSLVLLALLAGFQLAQTYIYLPLTRDQYTLRKRAAGTIARTLDSVSDPIYAVNVSHNMLFYSGLPLKEVSRQTAANLEGPGYVIAYKSDFETFSRPWRHRHRVIRQIADTKGRFYVIVRLLPEGQDPP